MKYLVTLVAVVVFLQSTLCEQQRFDNHKVYRLTPKNEDALDWLKAIEETAFSGYNFWSFPTKVGDAVDLMVPPYHSDDIAEILKQVEMDSEILIDDVQAIIDREGFRPRALEGGFGWDQYYTVDEINAWLESLAVQYPDKITLYRPGKSFEGREILGLKLSFSPENENRAVFIESQIHAREWITSAVTTYILNEFLTSTNTNVRSVAEKHDWYFFPIFNPDGTAYSQTTNRMWRKTRVPHRIFCWGSDPNRNWGYLWRNGGSNLNPCTETYAGPVPMSDPSTQVMASFIDTVADKLVAYLSFHSYSQMLLIPYGNTTDHLDNYDETKAIGDTAMEALASRYGTQYVVGNVAETIYIATGSSTDWVKGVHRVPIVYCYELRDRGQYGFLLPAEQIIPSGEETLDSVVSILEEYEKRYPEQYPQSNKLN